MNPLLFVFNPRDIKECVDSISRLPIDQCWVTGMREPDLAIAINAVIQDSSYSHYLCCSDDGVIPPFALEAVVSLLEDGHPVATGYSNLDATDMRVNLTKTPFRNHRESVAADYDLYSLPEIIGWPAELVPTHFAGFALTGMTRELWLEFPFRYDRAPSDWDLSRRLQDAEVPIVAHQAAFMWHVKERVNYPDTDERKRLLIGQVEAGVSWRERVAA